MCIIIYKPHCLSENCFETLIFTLHWILTFIKVPEELLQLRWRLFFRGLLLDKKNLKISTFLLNVVSAVNKTEKHWFCYFIYCHILLHPLVVFMDEAGLPEESHESLKVC